MSSRERRIEGGTGRVGPGASRLVGFREQYGFAVLLASLFLMFLAVALADFVGLRNHPVVTRLIFAVSFVALLVAAVFAVTQSRRSLAVTLSLAVAALFSWAGDAGLKGPGAAVASELVTVLFLSYTVAVVLRYLFLAEKVTFNVLSASVCVYFLLGLLWADVYSVVQVVDPAAFTAGSAEGGEPVDMHHAGVQTVHAIYFSFVTMTTLGYGDIRPVSTAAMMLATAQAVFGQIYLAVLVARLVGLHIAHHTASGQRESRHDAEPPAAGAVRD